MTSARRSSERAIREPRIRYSWWSVLAVTLVCTQVFPLPALGVREARADVIVVPVNGFCHCADQTTFQVPGNPNATVCNQPDTCLPHGGWVDDAGFSACECGDGSSFTIHGPPSEEVCELMCFGRGGWVHSDDTQIARLRFFRKPDARLRMYDPDTGAVTRDDYLPATQALYAVEQGAIDDVIQRHGLAPSERDRVAIWARDQVRAEIFGRVVEILAKPAAQRSEDEQRVHDWLEMLVWQRRVDVAQHALDQFNSLHYAVEYATCDWHSPNTTVVTLGRDDDGNLKNFVTTGCSPGVDGIPNTDPTPNEGTDEEIALGLDDGETCFAFDNFLRQHYDNMTSMRCAGVPAPFDVFAVFGHPTVEQFLEYGYALADRDQIVTPGFTSVLGNTYKALAFSVGAGTSLVAAGIAGRAIFAAGGWTAFANTFFPFAGRTTYVASKSLTEIGKSVASSLRIVSALGAAAVVLEVIFAIVTAVTTLLDIIEFSELPIKLKNIVRTAQGATETTYQVSENYTFRSGRPNLTALIATDDGKAEIFRVLVATMAPEIDLTNEVAPAHDSTLTWAVRDQNGNPIVTGTPETRHLLQYTAWDGSAPYEHQRASLFNGWLNTEATLENGTPVRALDLGLDYKACNGKERRAWRVPNDEFVTVAMGDTLEDADPEDTEQGEWFSYLDWNGQCRSARINHRPTTTGIVASGSTVEGGTQSFSATGADEDGDAVSFTWEFGDGATASGSSVTHAFANEGTYVVRATAVDAYGAHGGSRTTQVTVTNAPPSGTLVVPEEPVKHGEPFVVAVANVTDPSPADAAAGFEYAFRCPNDADFGPWSEPTTGGAETTCVATTLGDNEVAARIRDRDGGVTTLTGSVTVDNVPPTMLAIELPNEPIVPGRPYTVTARFTDVLPEGAYTVTFDWGDGTGSSLSTQIDGEHGSAAATHLYASIGTYVVKVHVTDPQGASSAPLEVQALSVTTGCRVNGVVGLCVGTPGRDRIIGTRGDDVIFGGDGNDTIKGNGGRDRLYGGAGNDKLFAVEGDDELYGGEGDDDLRGGAGNDLLDGGPGNDRIVGGKGDDRMFGGPGRDRLLGRAGADFLDGGEGLDVIDGGAHVDRCGDPDQAGPFRGCERPLED